MTKSGNTPKPSREERLAAQLRDNLRRRKAGARGGGATDPANVAKPGSR
jgi:hypothetical protein